jgi:NRPS condensation-like uncharacterized protein
MAPTFPLHLTHFENYMLKDDRPSNPMTFVVRFEFSGKAEPDALNQSLEFALERHPLLRAIVGPAKRGADCWIASEAKAEINWGSLQDPFDCPSGEYIDLRREPGLRLWVRGDESRSILLAQFHHAACDGIGSYQFLGDLLWKYAKLTSDAELPDLPELDPVALRSRAAASYAVENFRKPNGKFRGELGEFWNLAVRQQTPLTPMKRFAPPASECSFPGIFSHSFGKKEYKSIRLAAQEKGQTTNECLIEHLFAAIYDWNCQNGRSEKRQRLAVMVPMDLRQPENETFSATNCVTYAMLRRPSRELTDRSKFSESLGHQMSVLKRQRHSSSIMNICASMRRFPRIAQFALNRTHCLASAVLSNTGDPTRSFYIDFPREGGKLRCGNLLLESVAGVPPMRTQTNVTVSVFTYCRVLQLSVRCNPNQFSDADTQAFLRLYVKHISSEIS